MSEVEKRMSREIMRLESEKELLLKKLQIAEDMNFKQYQELMHLSYKVRMMEGR